MISATNYFKGKVNNGDAPLFRMKLLTASGDEYWIENGKFWANGISFSGGTSSNGSFDVGSAIIGSFSFILNNYDGDFDDIELRGAVVFPYAYYMNGENRDEIQKGQYYIASHTTSGYLIRCKALDAMKLFDQSDTPITYPVTFESLVRTLAEANNVDVVGETLPNGTYVIDTEPKDALTDRQKLSYACQITGNFATMNNEGELVIKWYDYANPVQISTTFDGKDLWTNPIGLTGLSIAIPHKEGEEAILRMDILGDGHLYFTNNTDVEVEFSINSDGELLATTPDGVTDEYAIINGVLYRTGGEYTARAGDVVFLYGTGENVLYIKDNPYITASNLLEIARMVGQRVLGQTIRPGTLPVLSNPCLEAGDVLQITDRVTELVYLLPITNFVYNRSITERVTCDFEAKEFDDLRPTSDYNIKEIIRKTVTTYYTWVAYADDASGTNISLSNTGKTYIGIASNQTSETPDITDPTVYQWKKYVGTGVTAITYFYKKQASSSAAPSTPTTNPPTGWVDTEPTYDPSTDANNVVYTTSRITYSDGTFGYTAPQIDTAFNANKEANNALTTANGKNKVYYQGTQPTGGTYVAGDTWFDTAHGNLIYEYNGSNWTTSHTFGTQAIADLAITNAKIAALDAGKIQTGELSTILIRSNNNDYWNLSGNDIVKTENNVTYTFKANTLQTNHLIAEDDVYVYGGSGSRLYIPADIGSDVADGTDDAYIDIQKKGMIIQSNADSENTLSTLRTIYPSDGTATHESFVYGGGDDPPEVINVTSDYCVFCATEDHEDTDFFTATLSGTEPAEGLIRRYDANGTMVYDYGSAGGANFSGETVSEKDKYIYSVAASSSGLSIKKGELRTYKYKHGADEGPIANYTDEMQLFYTQRAIVSPYQLLLSRQIDDIHSNGSTYYHDSSFYVNVNDAQLSLGGDKNWNLEINGANIANMLIRSGIRKQIDGSISVSANTTTTVVSATLPANSTGRVVTYLIIGKAKFASPSDGWATSIDIWANGNSLGGKMFRLVNTNNTNQEIASFHDVPANSAARTILLTVYCTTAISVSVRQLIAIPCFTTWQT